MADKDCPADGVVTGAATVDGRLVHLASQDFTVLGGSAGEVHSLKVADAMARSLKTGSPFIFINDSGGARVQEGIDSLSGYGQVFYHNVMLSGVVPQISLICGPCAGGAAYSPALTDFVIQTRQAQMFITGPQVIKQVTGEQITAEALGGADAHMAHSGVIHFIAENDEDAANLCRRLLSFLPSNNLEESPRIPSDDSVEPNPELNKIVPVDPKKAYDVRDVICGIVDQGDFLESQAGHAMNMVVGFGRIVGRSVGIIANQASYLSGAIDINAATKASRFIRFCNAFNIPLVTFRRCSRLLARRSARAWRDHSPRGKAALRLFGGHGAKDSGDSAQVVRRSACGDVVARSRGRLCAGLADGGGGRDGCRRGGGDRIPQGNAGGRG